jgi:hypothetical protein
MTQRIADLAKTNPQAARTQYDRLDPDEKHRVRDETDHVARRVFGDEPK